MTKKQALKAAIEYNIRVANWLEEVLKWSQKEEFEASSTDEGPGGGTNPPPPPPPPPPTGFEP